MDHLSKLINYSTNYGMSHGKLKKLIQTRNSLIPPDGYSYPHNFPEPHHILDIQPIPWPELRGTIED